MRPARETVGHTIASQPKFNTMNISKMSARLQYKDLNIAVKGSIRVITGKSISVSIQPALGLEIYRLEFTPEGFYIYDKMSRRYSYNSYEYFFLETGMRVDYNTIESLLSHRIFIPGSTDDDEICRSFKPLKMYDTISVVADDVFAGKDLRFDMNPENYRIVSSAVIDDSETPLVSLGYEKFKTYDKIEFPSYVILEAHFSSFDFSVTFTNDRIAFDREIFAMPIDTSRYTRVTIEDLANMKNLDSLLR